MLEMTSWKLIVIFSIILGILSIVTQQLFPQFIISTSIIAPTNIFRTFHYCKQLLHFYLSNGTTIKFPNNKLELDKTHKILNVKLLTTQELKLYDGEQGSKGLYLAILGRVYNVEKGKEHYGPGGGYHFFAGIDGSRAFVSGDFSEAGLIDDISGLTSQDYIGLSEWVSFYDKDYKFVGYLVGRYYDENGKPTAYNLLTEKWVKEAFAHKESENEEKKIFPPCNSEWAHDTGGRVWCSNKSGGIERYWVGVPRKLKNPGKGTIRCACVKPFGPPSHDPSRTNHQNNGDLDHPNLKEYEGCAPDQPTCINN